MVQPNSNHLYCIIAALKNQVQGIFMPKKRKGSNDMRLPNGYGSVKKLSGKKRRKPYGVYVTTGFEMTPSVPDIVFLKDILSENLYEQVQAEYYAYKAKQPPVAKQLQQCIGYYETRAEAMIALAEYNKKPFDINNKNITFSLNYSRQSYESA